MFVRAVFAEKTVLGKGIDEFARSPVAGRIGFLHLSQFGAHIEFVVKPGGISHCVILRRIIKSCNKFPKAGPMPGEEQLDRFP